MWKAGIRIVVSDAQSDLPNLICIGVEKCGTTLLHSMLSNCRQVATPEIKEVFFFNRFWERGLDWYRSTFEAGPARPVTADITPSYFRYDETLERIKDYSQGKDVRFLFLVRHPIYRAFSHYVHDLDRHHGPERTAYGQSFLAESHLPHKYHFLSYNKALKRVTSILGQENLLIIQFEALIKSPDALMANLGNWLNIPLDYASESRVMSTANSGSFPRYLYGGQSGKVETVGGQQFSIPARTLVFCSRRKPRVWTEVDHVDAQSLLDGSRNWTRELSAEVARDLSNVHFHSGYRELESSFGVDVSAWEEHRSICYEYALPPESFRSQ